MNVPEWYDEWAVKHAIAFGLGPEGTKTILAWGAKFVRLFSPDELYSATDHLTGREDVPKWAADHRGLIIATIRHLRQQAFGDRRPAAEGYAQGVCREHCTSGLLIVPHPGLDEEGRWKAKLLPPHLDPDGERSVTRTAAVCCVMCEKGRATRANSEQTARPMMTISAYEHRYPNWKAVLSEREEVLGAGRSPPTPEDRRRLDKLLAQVRRRAA